MRLLSLVLIFLLNFLPIAQASTLSTPINANDAFKLSVSKEGDDRLILSWAIAKDYYLYRDHIEARTPSGAIIALDTVPGTMKDDPTFGMMQVYYDRAMAEIPPVEYEKIKDSSIILTYQGCQEDGICYRPEIRDINLTTLAVTDPVKTQPSGTGQSVQWEMQPQATLENDNTVTSNGQSAALNAAGAAGSLQIAEDRGLVEEILQEGGAFAVIASFLVFGILLAFTPCVFPMYPIVAGTLAREGDRLTPWRGFMLTSVYVLALASAFAVIGAIAGWSGQNLQMALQSRWLVFAVSVVFVVLALSMFGLFELQLPSRWVSRVSGSTNKTRGSVRSAAILGFSSVLIVGPCVTAPLAGALLYIAQTANIALGAAALFALGVGKGIPLIIIATVGGKALPRAGAWMNFVKIIFGFGFLATAIWMSAPLLPPSVDLILWAILLFSITAYTFNTKWQSALVVARTIGTAALVYGTILMIGAASGALNPLQPLALLAGQNISHQTAASLNFKQVGNMKELQEDLLLTENKKPSMVYFTADWCVTCHTIDRSVFPDLAVRNSLQDFNLIKVDLSSIDPAKEEMMKQLQVAGPPTMLFFDESGKEVSGSRLVGSVSVTSLTASAEKTARS